MTETESRTFRINKTQPEHGEAECFRCGRTIYLARSRKNPSKIITVDARPGPYALQEDKDGTVLAKWAGPSAGYAYHYNSDRGCATDEEAEEANDL